MSFEVGWATIGKAKAVLASCGAVVPRRAHMLSNYWEFGRWLREHELRRKDSFTDRKPLYSHLNNAVLANGSIDYLEFGVFRGASLKTWMELNTNPDSRFYGFDSFEGLPEAWNHLTFSHTQGTFDVGGQLPAFDDQRVQLLKGWFQDSLPGFLRTFEPRNRMVLHLDADLYSSTLYVLVQLSSYLRKGTLIVFDDFSSTSTCVYRAFSDFVSAYGPKYRVVACSGVFFDQVCVEITAA